jgi:hypothetical protein
MVERRNRTRQGHLSCNAPIAGDFLIAGYAWTRGGAARAGNGPELIGVACQYRLGGGD